MSNKTIYEQSLDYHRYPKPGKLEMRPTKPMRDQKDLVLAYSPGVAAASRLIAENPSEVSNLTARANLVAVISNGTAVLGLGDIGALASKPVMEGKAVLFKRFAGVDVFDIEINEKDPEKLAEIIISLEPTFGGINLEDIKAPECFYVEQKVKEKLNIPVFHDDQHGTGVIVGAAVSNGLKLCGKNIKDAKLVVSGAGAAAIACLNILEKLGLEKKNIIVCDSGGVVTKSRKYKESHPKTDYAIESDITHLSEAIIGADIFLGVSVKGVLTKEMVKTMAPKPLILALANPDPEILPHEVAEVRDDAIVATGRSDYPNQVNNILCFPFLFRGALDAGATKITDEMKLACVHALSALAQKEVDDKATLDAYKGAVLTFGKDYIIPKPFDRRLVVELASAVAEVATKSGIATRPIHDIKAYREQLRATFLVD